MLSSGTVFLNRSLSQIVAGLPWLLITVGYGHLKDAWQVAEFQGNDPTRWDNVSKSLPLLANKKWYPFLSHGYARGWEPVIYVNNIRSYYEILTSITDKEETVATLVEAPINISDAL